MKLTLTTLPGVYTVELTEHADTRGFFARTWDPAEAEEAGLQQKFDYTCISTNDTKFTLRGMHYQKDPYMEVKLVRCTQGKIFDVALDLRPDSKTFKQWFGTDLSAENHRALYLPEGVAHGFLSLEDDSEVLYHMTGVHMPSAAAGVRFDDPAFKITWPAKPVVISDRDKEYPDFA